MTETIDLLIRARWIIPIEPENTVLEHHAIAVNRGRIVAILPEREASERFAPARETRLDKHVLMPGLVNLHCHAAMTLLRGLADDTPLMTWLQEHIWPAEAKHVSADFVHDGTLLACAEMLRGGITCFNDMYFFPEAAAKAVATSGMRAVIGLALLEFPTAYATDADDYLTKGLAARDALRDQPLLHFALAPHAPYTVSDRSFERIATLAAELDMPVHVHLHETTAEIEESLRIHGVRPLERLRRLGLITPNLIAVHAVHLDAGEIALLAAEGASVAHCPSSNLKLGSGIAPIAAMLGSGINIGLGTDGAASNNRLDLLGEMRLAALLAKGASGDASILNAHQALRAATLGGAHALGLDREIGSLLPGKSADLCAVSLDDPILAPCYAPESHMVYVAGRENVSHVWVAGNLMLENHTLTGFFKNDLEKLVSLWQTRVSPCTGRT
ncbi:MAG: 5-methylthioadenosine/S-adenosylhomocysteine deaminase [Pseudomonadota bacterium]|nr:5-methylthioadenosine/S-adenosylhomocysteine deaminase [Pseudomonadota bacterium]MDQ5918379.1 5-methylthioadenosine/S-adenosylhomocysteine deaminase [Pseudomonadota bacterium]MDQ5941976.1 5-methylthioadenosine/S-adenosylhomocysteine deaminase [Pseudomonadota bacterium]